MSIGSMFVDGSFKLTYRIDVDRPSKPIHTTECNVAAKTEVAASAAPVVSVEEQAAEDRETAPAPSALPVNGYRTFQVIPHAEVKNDRIDRFADVIADSYRELYQRWSGLLTFDDPDRLFFETVLTPQSFRTYLTTQAPLVETAKQQAAQTWRHVTMQDVDDPLADLRAENSMGYELRLALPCFMSLSIDRRMQETPLAEIAELTRGMTDGDRVIIQMGFQAAEGSWASRAEKSLSQFQNAKKPPRWWSKKPNDVSSATSMKPAGHGFDICLRILVTADDERRRRRLARGVVLALKQLDHDNQLIGKQVTSWRLKRWITAMQRREIRVPLRDSKRQILTGAEIAHLVKLPQRALQQEYREVIETVSRPEVALPDELFQADVPGIDIGKVVEKGVERTARVPVTAFGDTAEKYVFDAYCLPEFVFGEMGSGKTGEAIHRAHSAICNGQTAFFFDSADGAACRELHDSLPDDYPEEKIIHIDLTRKDWPIALRWDFNPGARSEDEELAAEEAREAGRMFLRQLVSGMATSEFTNRMDRYLAAAARAAGSAPLDIELALTSPAYREELLARPEIAEQLDIVADLQALQDKSRRGSDDISVDGILSRLRVLSADRFRTNLFYQEPTQPLDFRKFADNPEGGYGYCVTIYCDKTSYGPDGQEAILTYLLAKVLLEGAYSRVDIDPAARKPFVVLLDEPHRYIKGEMAAKLGEDAAVELRKYRCKLVMFGHSRAQLGDLWEAFEAGGIQVTMYKSKNVKAFRDMAAVIAPLDPEDAWSSLGQHEAVVTRKLPSKREVAFIAKMAAPPERVKDRSARREASLRQYGRPWKEVSHEIQERRMEYAQKDRQWHERVATASEQEKLEKRRRAS